MNDNLDICNYNKASLNEFIVCNNYLFPIEYKKIIENIDKEHLCAH